MELSKDDDDPQEILFLFVEKAKTMKEYILIVESVLSHNIALFGELENKWFLAVNNRSQNITFRAIAKMVFNLQRLKKAKISY